MLASSSSMVNHLSCCQQGLAWLAAESQRPFAAVLGAIHKVVEAANPTHVAPPPRSKTPGRTATPTQPALPLTKQPFFKVSSCSFPCSAVPCAAFMLL